MQWRIAPDLSWDTVYYGVLRGIDRAAYLATRSQNGHLRFYLSVMGMALVILVVIVAGLAIFPDLIKFSRLSFDYRGEILVLRIFSLLMVVGAAIATVAIRRDFSAILALGAVGLGATVIFILEPAPDVALVQVVVDILSVVILLLALARLPRQQRVAAAQLRDQITGAIRPAVTRNAVVAISIGILAMLLTFGALISRPRQSNVTSFYADNAKSLTGAADIVGAIVTDFRAEDTLIEITVFSMAGIGVYTLLRYTARRGGQRRRHTHERSYQHEPHGASLGISGSRTSAFIRASTLAVLPLSMVLAITHIMYGHDQPGDGFTAGVIISLAVGLWYVVFGYEETRRRLFWIRPFTLIDAGVLLAIATGLISIFFTGNFMSNVDFGEQIGLPLPHGFHISTSFLFEVAICLAVLGSASFMLDALGHPEDLDAESRESLDEILREQNDASS